MQQQPEQRSWTPIEDAKRAANLVLFVAQAICAPVVVFLRSGFGINYFGLPALAGFFAVLLWPGFWPDRDPSAMLTFWLLYLVMQTVARVGSVRSMKRGENVHSRYNGWPRLAQIFPRLSETTIKVTLEPALVFASGIALSSIDTPLGTYLVVAAVALFLTESTIESVSRARVRALNDALIEQQQLAERFRATRGGAGR